MATMARLLRAYHPGAARSSGGLLTLDADESHHVTRVLRLGLGAALGVFDGQGGEWSCTIEQPARSATVVRVGARRTDVVDPVLPVELYLALCQHERVEWAIQKATELGAAAVRVHASARSDAPPPSPERLSRWLRVAREACKQSGRRVLPEVTFEDVVPADAPPDTAALLLDPHPDGPPLGARLQDRRPAAVRIFIGPEGGLTDDEIVRLTSAGWGRFRLGPRILRAETAAAVAVALVMAAWGDLDHPEAGS